MIFENKMGDFQHKAQIFARKLMTTFSFTSVLKCEIVSIALTLGFGLNGCCHHEFLHHYLV